MLPIIQPLPLTTIPNPTYIKSSASISKPISSFDC